MNRRLRKALVLAAAMLLGGCLTLDGQEAAEVSTSNAEITPQAGYLKDVSVKAMEEADGESAVESALIWSEKYAQAVERLVRMQQENRQLAEANREQTERLSGLQAELKQCQKELGEANVMLLEMRAELEKWKTDVLGFRQEMRQAQQTQLIALHRVLKLLGGEVLEKTASSQQVAAAADEGSSQ